jgi:hypothetical protein
MIMIMIIIIIPHLKLAQGSTGPKTSKAVGVCTSSAKAEKRISSVELGRLGSSTGSVQIGAGL